MQELGYVEPRRPLALRDRPRRGYYRISDPYFRFWFRYVLPNRSRLERGRAGEVLSEIRKDLDGFLGHIFEDCCRTWVGRYCGEPEALASEEVGSWWSRDGQAEIDVVATRGRDYTLLGSCKWRKLVGPEVLDQLYEHRALLGKRAAQARLVLFAREGFTSEVKRRAGKENVLLVTAKGLFE